jgi:hypothetical protein
MRLFTFLAILKYVGIPPAPCSMLEKVGWIFSFQSFTQHWIGGEGGIYAVVSIIFAPDCSFMTLKFSLFSLYDFHWFEFWQHTSHDDKTSLAWTIQSTKQWRSRIVERKYNRLLGQMGNQSLSQLVLWSRSHWHLCLEITTGLACCLNTYQAHARMSAKHVAVTLKNSSFACLLLLTDKN